MWTINNQQADNMVLTLENGNVVNLPGNSNLGIASGIQSIVYHNLNYIRVGIWPFPNGQVMNISYPGQQNLELVNPITKVTAIFHHDGP